MTDDDETQEAFNKADDGAKAAIMQGIQGQAELIRSLISRNTEPVPGAQDALKTLAEAYKLVIT